jgi:SAM-dependent methyltransferase
MSQSEPFAASFQGLKLTRLSDDAVYVFLKGSDKVWTRTDRADIQIICTSGTVNASAGDSAQPEASDWYVTTAADSTQRLGWPAAKDLPPGADADESRPPSGRWLSAKAGKGYEYELQHLDCEGNLLADEYAAQERLQRWDAMLQTVMEVFRSEHGSDATVATFFDLGSGAGPISRRILEGESIAAANLISADLDPVMVAKSCWEGRKTHVQGGKSDVALRASFRVADLADLCGKSNYPFASWTAPKASKLNVVWSSFCTAYFPALSTVLRSWAESLLDRGGLMALVDIQGLFSAHGYGAETETGAQQPAELARRHHLNELFTKADESVARTLQNDVFVGRKLEGIVKEELGDVLEVVHSAEWEDPELAFDGRASPDALEQWRKRLGRDGIKKAIERIDPGEFVYGGAFADLFLECLESQEHTCRGKVKMVVLRKL